MSYDRERRMLLAGIGAASALAIARTARAASCGDPGMLGPQGPTMRDLYNRIAVEPDGVGEARFPLKSCPSSATIQYRIMAPGVYYMTENVTGVPGSVCVSIESDNVELECDGFCFIGVPGTLECIKSPSPHQAIGLYDGGIVDWQYTAIDLSNSSYCYCEELWWHRCNAGTSPIGVLCALGPGGTYDDCNVLGCLHGTLYVDRDGIVEECVVIDSTGGGISSPGPVVCEDNFVLNNDGTGIAIGAGGGTAIGNRVCSCPLGMKVYPSVGAHSSVVAENEVTQCTTGIEIAGNDVTVEENHVGRCSNAIVVSGSASRVLVDGNHCPASSSTAITLEAGTSRCLVIRNVVASAIGVPGFAFGGNNSWGPTVNANGVGDLTGSGTAVDPTANFEC